MKYLILDFQNARLFDDKKTKDFIIGINGKEKRSEALFFKESITAYQISNVIHVLFGERPVPSLRAVAYNKIDYIFEKAKESYLKIDSFMVFNKKKKQKEFVYECVQVKKMAYNSWNTTTVVFWERVKKLLDSDEVFNNFIYLLKEILNINPEDYTFDEVKEKLKHVDDSKKEYVFTYLKKQRKTSLISYLNDTSDKVSINKNPRTALVVNRGIEKVFNLSGTIIVPITEEDVIKIKNSKGHATILDGGLVSIRGIKDDNEINPEGFIKVSEISTEKY